MNPQPDAACNAMTIQTAALAAAEAKKGDKKSDKKSDKADSEAKSGAAAADNTVLIVVIVVLVLVVTIGAVVALATKLGGGSRGKHADDTFINPLAKTAETDTDSMGARDHKVSV